MSSLIRTIPCRVSKFSLTQSLDPLCHCLTRDQGMILCLNQDGSDFFIPPGWGKYIGMIQSERRSALNMKHGRSPDVRKNILTRRDLHIVPCNYNDSRVPKNTKQNERYLVMRWDLDIVLINPKRVPDAGSYHYRSSATTLPHEKIIRLALLIGERALTQWAYKWLDLHLPSMTSLQEVIFIDTNAFSYIQSVMFDLSNGGLNSDFVDPWKDESPTADLLKTYTLTPPLPRKMTKEIQDKELEADILLHGDPQSPSYGGVHNWGWIPIGPDGMSVIEMPEYIKMLGTAYYRAKPIWFGYMVHTVPRETAGVLKLIKWLDSI